MTHEERITVSIYTGVLMCDFGSMHKRIEELLGRPVWTHELAKKELVEELKEKVKPDFMKLCEGAADVCRDCEMQEESEDMK